MEITVGTGASHGLTAPSVPSTRYLENPEKNAKIALLGGKKEFCSWVSDVGLLGKASPKRRAGDYAGFKELKGKKKNRINRLRSERLQGKKMGATLGSERGLGMRGIVKEKVCAA